MFLRIRNTFLPKISLKPNILEIRKFVLTMRIAIINYFIRKAILRRIWLITVKNLPYKFLFLEKVIFYNIFASLKNN